MTINSMASLCLALISLLVQAQRITNFNLYGVGKSVGLNFTITKGSTCNGYKVLHSQDSLNYTVIEDYAGICGNSSEDVTNSYTHTNPVQNRYSYYKVQIALGETSEVKRIFVSSKNGSGLIISPNPAAKFDKTVELRTVASENSHLVGYLTDLRANKFVELDLHSNNFLTEISIEGLKTGIYLVWLRDGEVIYCNKLMILE